MGWHGAPGTGRAQRMGVGQTHSSPAPTSGSAQPNCTEGKGQVHETDTRWDEDERGNSQGPVVATVGVTPGDHPVAKVSLLEK